MNCTTSVQSANPDCGKFTNKLQGMKEMDRNLLKDLKEMSKFKKLSKTIVSRRAYLDLKNYKNVRKQ